jgi:hypothetical protein
MNRNLAKVAETSIVAYDFIKTIERHTGKA